MTPLQIRAVAWKLDEIAIELCPDGCRADLILATCIDHLFAVARAEEANAQKRVDAGETK